MFQTPSPDQWINVEPPVSVRSENFKGHLMKFSRDSLILKGNDAKQKTFVESENLCVQVLKDKTHQFKAQLKRTSDDLYHCKFTDQANLTTLTDLSNVLRKSQHIHICNRYDVESTDKFNGFSKLSFIPKTIPEMNVSECQTSVNFLDQSFAYPILITGMTGGIQHGAEINMRLAKTAQTFKIPMGVGSQRLALENSEYEDIFKLKNQFPDLYLIGNLGASQLLDHNWLDSCKRAIDMIQANALAIHINIIQELVQIEGDRSFKGIFERIESLCHWSPVPIIIKEVGAGMDPHTALRLEQHGVAAIDVGGKGGTSWSYVEALRSRHQDASKTGEVFRDWGIPTAYSLSALLASEISLPLIATGGIRSGLSVAKAVALGAHLVGVGLPLLRAAVTSAEAVEHVMNQLIQELKITMVATGSQDLSSLRKSICLGEPFEDTFKHMLS